jgi:hypothetical protein
MRNARHVLETEAARRLDARRAIQDQIVLANNDRRAEAKRADRVGNLSHARRTELADLTRRHLQTFERHVRQFEARQQIVAEHARRRLGFGHSGQIFPTMAALPLS